ncbi:hypothetical protein BT69DRAFT_911517 [Atractiella rhizophila]|nr:hypothetical protein BT69DRAFT_911517 [Atractiella rhizophila]
MVDHRFLCLPALYYSSIEIIYDLISVSMLYVPTFLPLTQKISFFYFMSLTSLLCLLSNVMTSKCCFDLSRLHCCCCTSYLVFCFQSVSICVVCHQPNPTHPPIPPHLH